VGPEPSRRLPRLTAPIDALSPIVTGTLSAARAAEVGLASATAEAAEIVDAWFHHRPVHVYQFNAF